MLAEEKARISQLGLVSSVPRSLPVTIMLVIGTAQEGNVRLKTFFSDTALIVIGCSNG